MERYDVEMGATTVNQGGNPRSDALVHRIARIEPDAGLLDAVALGLVDAMLDGDAETLEAALAALRDARARSGERVHLTGWLDAAIAVAHWALERVPAAQGVPTDTQAHDFLSLLAGSPRLGSAELRRLLETDETQVSRTGRRLLDRGLVTRTKVGRHVFWNLTPRGRHTLEQAPTRVSPDTSSFWLEAIRRGFDGDVRRDLDPTRERIIECALELHGERGIRATTWQEIAGRAGVPVETVETEFPTFDGLVRSCAEHFLESLRMPPPARAGEVFAGSSSRQDRVRRLVDAVFGVYERGASGIAVGRREHSASPAVRESLEQFETSLDALVTEALRPRRPDSGSVTSLRALTDLEVWRTLREQGVTQQAAVAQTTATVDHWLEGHPVDERR